jgi:fructosamine-3-kinase
LLFASLAGFSFKALGISDEELAEFHISNGHDPFNSPEKTEDWENIYADQRITVYRRKMNGKGIYEYRCIGSYPDISADDFIQAQVYLYYR